MASNPICHVCDEAILPGERRVPGVSRTGQSRVRHWACGSLRGRPSGILGRVEPDDLFKVCFNGSTWHYASVEGWTTEGTEYVVRGILRDSEFGVETQSPLQFSSQIDIVTTPHGNSWSDPIAFEVDPDWPAMNAGPGRSFSYDRHAIGPVQLRPVCGSQPPAIDSFWESRPTTPAHLFQRYVVERATTMELAQEFDVSGWTVRNWMDRANITRRTFVPTSDSQQADG